MDEADLKHLGSYSAQWWDVNGPFKPLHLMNNVRVPLIRDGLISTGLVEEQNINKPDVLKGINILEVGCGAGILTEALGRLRANVTGLDPSEELIEAARNHLNGQSLNNVEYVCNVIEEHAINNVEKYDAVIASEVVEHVPDQKSFLHECTKCLKTNGSIFVTTFNKTQASWLAGIVVAEYILNLVPKGTHDWNQFISPSEVTKILSEQNCNTVLVHGLCYNILDGSFSFKKYDGINYALQAVKNDS